MHSLLSRGNSVLAYTLSVLVTLTFACFLSTILVDYRTGTEMKTLKIEVKNLPEYGVILWDKIILRGENANLRLKNMRTKYYFWDDGNGLRGNKNVTLTLSYNIIPNVGRLPIVGAIGSHTFSFPSEYTR
ncbi:hypothetical protein ACI65C_007785 [Semiaphis heraclei]